MVMFTMGEFDLEVRRDLHIPFTFRCKGAVRARRKYDMCTYSPALALYVGLASLWFLVKPVITANRSSSLSLKI